MSKHKPECIAFIEEAARKRRSHEIAAQRGTIVTTEHVITMYSAIGYCLCGKPCRGGCFMYNLDGAVREAKGRMRTDGWKPTVPILCPECLAKRPASGGA